MNKEDVKVYERLWPTHGPQMGIYDTRMMLIETLRALEWCGGSGDFSPGGKARVGWRRYVLPLLKRAGLSL